MAFCVFGKGLTEELFGCLETHYFSYMYVGVAMVVCVCGGGVYICNLYNLILLVNSNSFLILS